MLIKIKILLRYLLDRILYYSFFFIPKNNKLVLFTAWFGQKYIDNKKYVYEYLLENSSYQVVWLTKNKDVFQKLREEGKPVALFKSLYGFWLQIRCIAVFSTVQFSDYNNWLLNRCLYIDLGHGHPIKDPGEKTEYVKKVHQIIQKRLIYYSIVASDFSKSVTPDTVNMPLDRIIISDYARNDVFIYEYLRKGKNIVVDNYKSSFKAIVYMPTHRSDGRNVLNMMDILPLDNIQHLCEKYGYVFIIKKHFYHRNEVEDLSMYNRIFDITNVDDIDPQVLLYQTDILISDYSACYIDYLLLDRKLCFYQFDSEEFQKNERSLYIPFTTLDIAPIAYDKDELALQLSSLLSSEVDEYKERRNNFAPTYFANLNHANGCKKVKNILDSLMKKYYPNN